MGTYVYRVTAKTVLCNDGKLANAAVFAYKPSFSGDADKFNRRADFQSGCPAARRLAASGKLTGRIILTNENVPVAGSQVLSIPKNWGTFYDTSIDGEHSSIRAIPDVKAV